MNDQTSHNVSCYTPPNSETYYIPNLKYEFEERRQGSFLAFALFHLFANASSCCKNICSDDSNIHNTPQDLIYGVFLVLINQQINFRYLYTVGLLSPQIRASSLTFIFPSAKAG